MPQLPPSRIAGLRDGEEISLYPPSVARHGRCDSCSSIISEPHRFQDWEVPEHVHADFCLHLQKRGTPSHEWWWARKNAIESRRAGSLILLPPGTRDRVRWMGPSDSLIFSVDPRLVGRVAQEICPGAQPSYLTRWHFQDEALKLTLLEIADQAENEWPLGRLYGDLLELSLASLILRRHTAEALNPPPIRGGLSARILRRCLEFMTENMQRSVALDEIAEVSGLSTFHFARTFRKMTRQTPHQYLLDQRMRRARELLRTTTLAVSEIGAAVGFPGAAHFTQSFRLREGLSPKAWRATALS
jgi:AraC family transcriptional regulator